MPCLRLRTSIAKVLCYFNMWMVCMLCTYISGCNSDSAYLIWSVKFIKIVYFLDRHHKYGDIQHSVSIVFYSLLLIINKTNRTHTQSKWSFNNIDLYRQEGLDFVRSLEAGGGTDINSAVITAIDQLCGDNSSCVPQITLLSDGLATSGEIDSSKIADNIRTRCQGIH